MRRARLAASHQVRHDPPDMLSTGVYPRWRKHWLVRSRAQNGRPVQLICPCLVGRKDLMTKFYPAAVGDTTRTLVRQSLRREDGAGIIGGASRRN
jgi:hypothetical protein